MPVIACPQHVISSLANPLTGNIMALQILGHFVHCVGAAGYRRSDRHAHCRVSQGAVDHHDALCHV